MEWMIICIFVVGVFCFFVGFGIRRSNRQNGRDEVLINDSNNRQNESDALNENRNNMIRESTGAHEVILDINKDLSISHSSYQINSKVLKKKSNSFGGSRIQNLAISKTNLIINNNIGIRRDLQNKYGSLKIVEKINFDVIDNRHYCNKGMGVFRQPGIFRKRLEELEKIEKQETEKIKQRLSRRYRKTKSKIKDMPAPEPIYEDIKEDDKNIKNLTNKNQDIF